MLIFFILLLLVVALGILISLIKDKKVCNQTKKKIAEISAYTPEHVQSLELDGISATDELAVAKIKYAKFKKKFIIKLVALAVIIVVIIIL